MSVSSHELLPSARRLIGSLRDIGYDLTASIADLVDNSIAAGATRICIDMEYEGAQSWIRIADDGCGMTRAQLDEALRFGSRREYHSQDLGRFGLGLKLATLSQCRLVTVASRRSLAGRIVVGQWDLDHVEATDRWEVLRPSVRDTDDFVIAPLNDSPGTVVMLDELDRVLRYANPDATWAAQAFARSAAEVREHLSMIFHRFLSGEDVHEVSISFNGSSLAAWDPFCRDEPATLRLPERYLRMEGFAEGAIRVRPFILPNEASFSSPEAHARAAGPTRWNRQQGLYVYRNGRLIQSGGWSRLRTADEHTKLARIALDFPAVLDEAFSLNIAKSQVRLPPSLRDQLGEVISAVSQLAQRAYRSAAAGPDRHAAPEPEAKTTDPRVVALSRLVSIVVEATEDCLRTELGETSLVLARTMRRLRHMHRELEAELLAMVATPRDRATVSKVVMAQSSDGEAAASNI